MAPWKRALITRSMALVPCLLVAVYFGGKRDGLDVLNGVLVCMNGKGKENPEEYLYIYIYTYFYT